MGLGHVAFKDAPGWQGDISYAHLGSPHRSVEKWRSLGITHIVWRTGRPGLPRYQLASEAVFAEALANAITPFQTVGNYHVAEVRTAAHAPQESKIAVLSCGEDPAPGLYTPLGLHNQESPFEVFPPRIAPQLLLGRLENATSVILYTQCPGNAGHRRQLLQQFQEHSKIKDTVLFVRRVPTKSE
jgi:hypothetical protein